MCWAMHMKSLLCNVLACNGCAMSCCRSHDGADWVWCPVHVCRLHPAREALTWGRSPPSSAALWAWPCWVTWASSFEADAMIQQKVMREKIF
jgi:hypothetical protein